MITFYLFFFTWCMTDYFSMNIFRTISFFCFLQKLDSFSRLPMLRSNREKANLCHRNFSRLFSHHYFFSFTYCSFSRCLMLRSNDSCACTIFIHIFRLVDYIYLLKK
uniref:Uncharacterized protein MANES_13G017200 n=1 Tax=Rhizophora mucronata TaxID=61149 RepID=A0A2P2JZA2_RHIMU